MTKQEALEAMAQGKKITHRWFNSDEWMKKGSVRDIEFEDGCQCSSREFWSTRTDDSWDDGWSTYNEESEMQLVGKKDPILKTKCKEISNGEDVSSIVDEMFKLMRKEKGVGLAAPQVGIDKRLIVVEYASTSIAVLNPVITKSPGKVVTSIGEGCLSFPNKRVNIKRSKRVVIEGYDINWNPIKLDVRNFEAFIFQHEIDHLNGITIGDIQ